MTAWTTYAIHRSLNNAQHQQQTDASDAHAHTSTTRGGRAWLVYEDDDGCLHLLPRYAPNGSNHLPSNPIPQCEDRLRPNVNGLYAYTNSFPEPHHQSLEYDEYNHTTNTQHFVNGPDPGPSGANREPDNHDSDESEPPLSIRRLGEGLLPRYSYSNDQLPETPVIAGQGYIHSQPEEHSFLFHPGSLSPASNQRFLIPQPRITLYNNFAQDFSTTPLPLGSLNDGSEIQILQTSNSHSHVDVNDSGYYEENSRDITQELYPNLGLSRTSEITNHSVHSGVDEITTESPLLAQEEPTSGNTDSAILEDWLSSLQRNPPRYPRVYPDSDVRQPQPRRPVNYFNQLRPLETMLHGPTEESFLSNVAIHIPTSSTQIGDPNNVSPQNGITLGLPSVPSVGPSSDGVNNKSLVNLPNPNPRGILQLETNHVGPSTAQPPPSRRVTWDPSIPRRQDNHTSFPNPITSTPALPRPNSTLHELILQDGFTPHMREHGGSSHTIQDDPVFRQSLSVRPRDDLPFEQRARRFEFTEADGVRLGYIIGQRHKQELSQRIVTPHQAFNTRANPKNISCSYCKTSNCHWQSKLRFRPYANPRPQNHRKTSSQKRKEARGLRREPYLVSRSLKRRYHSDRSQRTVTRRHIGIGHKRSRFMPWYNPAGVPATEPFLPILSVDTSKWKDLPQLPSNERWSRMFPTPETRKWMPVPPFPEGELVIGFPPDPPNLNEMRYVDVDPEEACPSLSLFDPVYIASKRAKRIVEDVAKYEDERIRGKRPIKRVWRKVVKDIRSYISSAKQLSLPLTTNSTIRIRRRLSTIQLPKLSLFKSSKESKGKGREINQNTEGSRSTDTLSTLSVGIFTPVSRPSTPIQTPPTIELNPLLRHDPHSPERSVIWHVSLDPCTALYPPLDPNSFLTSPPVLPINDVHFHGPATIPPITKMKIDKLADFPLVKCLKLNSKLIPKRKRNGEPEVELRSLPWPMVVHGTGEGGVVRVIDIYTMIFQNFSMYITQEEFRLWGKEKQGALISAFEQRRTWEKDARSYVNTFNEPPFASGSGGGVRLEPLAIPEKGLMRSEWLGTGRTMFRGVEKSPEGDGWTLFIGSSNVTSKDACIYSKESPSEELRGAISENVEVEVGSRAQ